jgi:hypothetical protein
MRNVSDKTSRENQNTHFIFRFFFPPKIVPFVTMWRNTVEPGRPQMTILRMRILRQIHKATNTHSEYVMPTAFRLQQWLQELTLMLRCT